MHPPIANGCDPVRTLAFGSSKHCTHPFFFENYFQHIEPPSSTRPFIDRQSTLHFETLTISLSCALSKNLRLVHIPLDQITIDPSRSNPTAMIFLFLSMFLLFGRRSSSPDLS
jgi:hypothetical protein